MMNPVPKEWTSDRLKDVSEINASSLPANTDADYEFDYLEISNVNYHGIIDPKSIERLRYEDAPSRARRCLGENCTAISSVRPNLQAVAFIENTADDLVCSTGFNVVQPVAHKLAPKFTYYSLLSDGARQYFEATAKGVGYPAVDDKDFLAFRVPLPPLPEQRRITAYLDSSCAAIDAAIEAKRQQIDTCRQLRETVIQTAVTQGLNPKAKMTASDIDWIPSLPHHWKEVKLKRHVEMLRGQFSHRPRNDPAYYDGPYPFIQTGSISAVDKFITEYSQTLNELGLSVSKMFPAGTIVMTITGAKIAEVAVTTFDACFPDSIVGFVPDHALNKDFLFYVLMAMKPALLGSMIVTTQPNINYVQIGGNYIPIPPLVEQEAIVQHIETEVSRIKAIQHTLDQQIATLTAYRKSLIHECVTGQRRITDADLRAIRGKTANLTSNHT